MKVTYSSNNSGGNWWLKDEDWIALERAGWQVEWGKTGFDSSECKNAQEAEKHRFIGALATQASKEFSSFKDALLEFESITGQSVTDEGCHCCGAPHSFSTDDYSYSCSGEDCMPYLYDDVPHNFREAVERLSKR